VEKGLEAAIAEARAKAEKHFPQFLEFIEAQDGAFLRGQAVQLTVSGSTQEQQMSQLVRLFRDHTATYLVILVFVILYVITYFPPLVHQGLRGQWG
jgi:hypothetical protein